MIKIPNIKFPISNKYQFDIGYLKLDIKNSERGFTLIEMVVAIGIMGVLAAFVIGILDPFAQYQKANDSRRKSDLAQIQRALEAYYQDVGKYPPMDSTNHYIVNLQNQSVAWGQSFSPYMSTLPKDPSDPTRKYVYYTSATRQSYYLYASLERGSKDSQACNSGNACSSLNANGLSTTACGSTCNYAVTSPNVSP